YERRDCNGVVLYKVKGVYIYIYCYWCKSLLQDGDGCYIELPHDILDIKRVTDLLDYQVMTSIHIGIGNMPDRPQTHYSFQLNELSSRRISVEQMQKNINEDNANDNRHNMQSLTTHQVDKSSSQYQSSREWPKVSISKPIEVESNCSIVQTKESAPTVNKVSSHYETSKDWPVVEQTDSEHKGFAFEKFIDAHFPNKYFKRLEWRSDIKDGSGRLSESSKYPDLEYEIRKSGVRFAVECKWRHNFLKKDSDLIIWWAHDEKQINNYVQYGKWQNIDVVVIIGVGGTPDNPDKVYSIPLSKISSPYLTKDDLWNYFVGKQSSFFYNQTEHNIRLYHK
ncbi:MAG: hypothetical protein IJU23_03460, partial [Proteobacteria bacterium]|nr:hypothetical protein [Pseudomonadota bacterium]